MLDIYLNLRLLHWFRNAAYKESPVDSGSALVFRVARPARYFFGGGILFMGAFGILSFVVEGIEWYIRALYPVLLAFVFMRWPWAVTLDHEGVSKRSYFGRRKTIPWHEVSALTFDQTSGAFTVAGKFGQQIRCFFYMAAPAVFYAEMYKRAPALGPMPTRQFEAANALSAISAD